MGELSREQPVVVHCAYGFHVGRRTAMALRDAGFDARYMTVRPLGLEGRRRAGQDAPMSVDELGPTELVSV
jgi:rhodanese-related sulfurtransferase